MYDWIPDLLDLIDPATGIVIWCISGDGLKREGDKPYACKRASVFHIAIDSGRWCLRRCGDISVCAVIWCDLSAAET